MERRSALVLIPAFFGYLSFGYLRDLALGQEALGQENNVYIKDVGYVSSSNSNWNERPEISIPTTEQTIHILTNQERYKESMRTRKKIPQLGWDAGLANIARSHSRDMSENDFFSHDNRRGMNPTARADAYGYAHKRETIKEEKRPDGSTVVTTSIKNGIGENIFMHLIFSSFNPITTTQTINGRTVSTKKEYHFNWNSQNSISSGVVEGWMNSQGHRKNILNPEYRKEGIGAFLSYEKNHVMVTQNFW